MCLYDYVLMCLYVLRDVRCDVILSFSKLRRARFEFVVLSL